MDQAAAERKQSIAERAAKATQGKWWWIGDTAGFLCLAARRVSPWHNVIEIDDSLNRLTISEADRAFISHARVDIEWLLSQLSASEERVRALTELLRQSIAYFNGYVQDEAVEEEICVDHEHHVAAQKFKQALKEAESLLPSPPQVIRG